MNPEVFSGRFADPPQLPTPHTVQKVLDHLTPPQKGYNVWGGTVLEKTVELDSSRNWQGYAVMPLVLITVPLDITATIVLTTFQLITMPAVELYNYSFRW